MKRFLPILLAIATFAQVGQTAPAEPATPQPLTAAVLDFQVSGPELEKKGAEAAALLNARLSTAPNLILVERQELDKILGEQELGISGTLTPDTAAKVGHLTGAKVLIMGRLFGADGKFYAVAKIVGTETSRVYGETAMFGSPDRFNEAIDELAPKLVSTLEKRGDTLVAKAEDPAARLERLKKLVTGKKLPSVSVVVAEQHINHAVVDPAAETEIKRTLQQLGFEVIDPKVSGAAAGVAVSGEGFSELAGRRGNLVSCRARVEIKAARPSNGALLLSDRQTAVAVDLSENIAGKAALENAANGLLERLVPALVATAANQ